MKLRRGRPRYKIPPYSQILDVRIEGNTRHNQMMAYLLPLVRLEDLGSPDQVLAQPIKCAVQNEIIEFAPSPDKPYIVKVRYTPPVQEF